MTEKNGTALRSLLALVWLLLVVRALIYIAATPLWEGFDELFHFAYIHSLASTGSLPVWGETFIDAEIATSTAYVPLAGLMPQLAPGFKKLSYRDYWEMEEAQRDSFREQLDRLQASASRLVQSSVPLYQTQHPPLYYALCVPLYKAMEGRSLVDKVFAVRILSIILASAALIAVALMVKDMQSPLGATFAVSTVLWPCLYIDISRVGNDSLGVAVFSFVFLAMVRYGARPTVGRAITVGIFLGLGLLTKAYFLTAIPAIALFILLLALEDKPMRVRMLRDACALFACAGVIGGWWYLRNYRLYGTFSGLQESLYFPSVGLAERVSAVLEVPWVLVSKHLFVTFCWINGWSFLLLSKPVYLVFVVLFVLAGIGLARMVISGARRKGDLVRQNRLLAAAGCLVLLFVIGVAYHKINAYGTVRFMGGPGGWYFYAIVAPISSIVALGLSKAWPKFARGIMLTMFVALVMVEVYGFLMVLVPYYTGMAVPASSGWGVTFVEGPMQVFSKETAAHLTVNAPRFLQSNVLLCLAVVYCGVLIALFRSVLLMKADVSPSAPSQA